MGNGQGRPRTGLPAAPRALEPGVALSDVRDLDVVVLRDDAGVPLRLDVSEDPIPSTSGNRRPRDDPPAVEVSYELVSGGAETLEDAASRVVVDAEGRWIRFRSVVADDAYLCAEPDDDSPDGSARTRLLFRRGRAARRRGTWSWSYDEARDVVSFASRSTPAARLTAAGPGRMSRASAARHFARFLRDQIARRERLAATLAELDAEADRARRRARDELTNMRDVLIARAEESRRRDDAARRRETRRGIRDESDLLRGLTGVVDALRDQVKSAAAEPVRLALSDANLDVSPPTSPWRIHRRKSTWRSDAAKDATTERREIENDGDDERDDARERESSSWRVDEDHLEEVSRIWDMSVATFRDALNRHGVDDEPIAALQEAIRESAREHYVAEGMRRYLLNRDDESERESDREDGSGPGPGPGPSDRARSWVSAIEAESAKREEAAATKAARRARFKAKIRAGEAEVDFRGLKVGTLREKLERSGVDAGPLAATVHVLAHAARDKSKTEGGAGRRTIADRASSAAATATATAAAGSSPASSRNDAGAAFRNALARERLAAEIRFLRAEHLVDARAGIRASGEDARLRSAMSSPAKSPPRESSRGRDGTRASRGETPLHADAFPRPYPQTTADASALRRSTVRAAARSAAAAAAVAERELRGLRGRDSRAVPAATLAVVTFIDGMSLDDLRAELESNSLLAGGLDECVDALVETEWEGGDDGFIRRKGERAAALRRALTVERLRHRLAEHGLEGSLLELDLLVNALASAMREGSEEGDGPQGAFARALVA